MNKNKATFQYTSKPLLVTVGFFLLLIVGLLLRVYQADRDLGTLRLAQSQSELAAESGLHFSVMRIREKLNRVSGGIPSMLSWIPDLSDPPKLWRTLGGQTPTTFRGGEIRRLPGFDRADTLMLDEANLYRITAEGRCYGARSKAIGIVAATPLVKRFAVVNSLNEYYFGQPFHPWVREAKSLEAFLLDHAPLLNSGAISQSGMIFDPDLLVRMFKPQGEDPLRAISGKDLFRSNYAGIGYKTRDGVSPCQGPLYCSTPIVVDSHTFQGPVQTPSFLYRRGESRPLIRLSGQSAVALPSSRRIQLATDKAEGEIPDIGAFIDQDTNPRTAFLAPWRPAFTDLRDYARKNGIYVDATGKGFWRGDPFPVDFHLGKHQMFSESYFRPTQPTLYQDESNEDFIVLSTASRYQDKNNCDRKSLRGSTILYSELSIEIRGEVESDLMVVTPHQIYITGSINPDTPTSLMLVAGEGCALSTQDIEEYCLKNNPSQEVREAARQWIVRAAIYKPGAGWYGKWSKKMQGEEVVEPRNINDGARVSVKVIGACLEGNLSRWLRYSAEEGVKIQWDPTICDRLPFEPISINLVRTRVLPENAP